MPTSTVRAGTSGWVSQQVSTKAYGAATTMQLAEQSGSTGYWKYPLLYIKSPAPSGATITSATLTVYARGASTGTRHLIAQRLTQTWKVSTVTYANRPAVFTTAADTDLVGTLADASPVTIDITDIVASWASGAANDGIMLSTDTTTTWTIYGYGSAYPPVLKVTWDDPPAKPTHLIPSGGIVGLPAWTCQWAYADVDGDALQAVRVQLSATKNWTAPDYDSGTVTTTHPELNLASFGYAGLASNASTYWRCQVQDSGGAWSVWSDPAQVTYISPGTVTLTGPTAADPHIHDPAGEITWTFSGTPVTNRIQLLNASNAIIADSGLIVAPSGSSSGGWTIPAGMINDTGTYTVKVAIRDGLTRVSMPGSDGYARAQQAFTFAAVPTVAVPAALVASEVVDIPAVLLTWTDTGGPDYFTVYRDGSPLIYTLDANSVNTGGTAYAWTDYHAKVGVTHTYALRGVLAHQASNLSATATILLARSGIYLTDPATGRWFVVNGQDVSNWAMSDNVAVYSPLSSAQRVQVTQGQYGLAGTVSGVLLARPGGTRTATDFEADLYVMKETPEATYRLVLGDINIPVKVSNLSVGPSPDSSAQNIRRIASYSFFQCGEFGWTPRL
jgi:hypothetical protein